MNNRIAIQYLFPIGKTSTRLSLFILITLYCLHSTAQPLERRIFILDGTGSMVGANGAPNVWGKVKEKLIPNIEAIDPKKSETYLIVFSNQVDHFLYEKMEILTFLKGYTPNGLYTNSVSGWDKALSLLTPDKYNFITLLTDGADNDASKGANMLNRLQDWSNVSKSKNAYACIVRLTDNAMNKAVEAVINSSQNIKFIDGIKFPAFLILQKDQDISFNHKGGYHQKHINIFVKTINENDLPESATINFNIGGTDAVSISPNTTFKRGTGKIDVELKKKGNITEEYIPFKIIATTSEPDLILGNSELDAVIENYPIEELNVNIDPNFGTAHHYDNFLFFKGRNDTLKQTIKLNWNQDAIAANSSGFLHIDVNQLTPHEYALFRNGELIQENKVPIDATMEGFELGFAFANNPPDQDYVGKAYTSGTKIKKSNIEKPVEIAITRNGDWHPVKTVLFYLLIGLLIILLFWIFILKHLIYPVFPAISIQFSNPYYKLIRLKGARRIIMTARSQKQGVLNRFIKGKVIYEVNTVWQQDFVLEPKDRKSIRVISSKGYSIEPYAAALTRGSTYRITENNSKQIIETLIQ